MRRAPYDAIVIGSGISGGWAAKELSEKGLNVLVLEAGRTIDPARDYLMNAPAFEFDYRYLGDVRTLTARQPVQRKCYACDEGATQFFVDDVDNPYTTAEGKPFDWIRGRQLGGKSIMWGRQCYRWSDLDFGANAKDGHGTDWPVRYKDLAPWYDYVEGYAGISGEKLGLPQLPDGPFLPPMQMSCAETFVRDNLRAKYNAARVLTIGRTANLTEAHNGRAACHYCDACHRGCTTAAYFNSVQTTLKDALATGRCTIRPFSVVQSLVWNEESGKVTGVRVIDGQTMESLEFNSRIVFLNCSALESTRILLNSKSRSHPEGLGGNSGVLGRYVMDHTMQHGAGGKVAWLRGQEDLRFASQRRLSATIPECHRCASWLPSRLRLPGWRFAVGAGVGPWCDHARLRCRFQECAQDTGVWRLANVARRLRRVSTVCRQPRHHQPGHGRPLGHSGVAYRCAVARE